MTLCLALRNACCVLRPGHYAHTMTIFSGSDSDIYFGLMSGTRLDGVEGIAARFERHQRPRILAESTIRFDAALRAALFALQTPADNEIDCEARAAHQLAEYYARTIHELLARAALTPERVRAVGVHGQTIRHCTALGYTRQIHQPARIAELTGIDIAADFRSRDIAAGGQGAPLAPAFHAMCFSAPDQTRVVCNMGGISNITLLSAQEVNKPVMVFDCGPGNVLLDAWAQRQWGVAFDQDGRFAARGCVNQILLHFLLDAPYFTQPPPKSTGRDVFNSDWLDERLAQFAASCAGVPLSMSPEDIQATLTALTATTVARDIVRYAPACRAVYVCGGGARNPVLMGALKDALQGAGLVDLTFSSTDALGIPAHQVEALAFAWLGKCLVERMPVDLPSITGAQGPRVLGALYPK